MANPTHFTWTQPLVDQGGVLFTQARYNGYEIEINGAPAVSIPVGWDSDGEYSFPIADAVPGYGLFSARIRVLSKDEGPSGFSNAATFVIAAPPVEPQNFSVA
jgi:hypothetical protein